jgi:hypothetical protein
MTLSPTIEFAHTVRRLGRVARLLGLQVPGFRTPPRLAGVDRSLRRRAGGSPTVAVRLKGRPWTAVQADLVDGVIAANALTGHEADRARAALWAAIADGPPSVGVPARVA